MKGLKFRYWYKDQQAMSPGMTIGESLRDMNDDSERVQREKRGFESVMQYIGWRDRFGKEIYFGDIVYYKFHDKNSPEHNEDGRARVIETMNGGAGLLLFDENIIEDFWPDSSLWTIEVIGNMYENEDICEL